MVALFRLNSVGSNLILRAGLVVLAVMFFLIGMEEISWMQRVLGFETPGQLEQTNIQGEMNLHNLATEPVEIAYYFSAFVFTVILPFMRSQGIFPLNNPTFALLVPRPFLIFIGALICAFNYDMWNIFLIQAAFYGSCFTLAYFIMRAADRRVAGLAAAVLFLTVTAQVSFIAFADNYAREWELTEYKELLIPWAFLAYSLDVVRQVRERSAGQTATAREPLSPKARGGIVSRTN